MYNGIIIRLNEIGLKSRRKRPFFERSMINGIQDAFSRNSVSDYKIVNIGQIFLIKTKNVDDCIPVLKKIPGIQFFSPCVLFAFESFDNTKNKTVKLATPFVKDKTFRVTAKRSGPKGFTSMQLAAKCGEDLMDKSSGVDLYNPQVTINIEVRGDYSIFYTESFKGLSGLPPKSAGKLLCLFSGGIDSPVAAYQMLRRGCVLDYAFVNLVGESSLEQVAPVYNMLVNEYQYSYKPRFFEIDGRPLVKFLNEKVNSSMRQIALKIAFYKLSIAMCKEYRLWGTVTGEALSQKSSQTLQSLSFIQENTSAFVLRPLLSMDKEDIINIARKIGTFVASQNVKEVCNLSDGGAVTAVPIKQDISKIPNLDSIIEEILKSIKITQGLIPENLSIDSNLNSLDVDEIVDLRVPSLIKVNPINSSIQIPYPDILEKLDIFEKEKTYLFVCSQGVLSQEVKFILSKRGIKAFALSIKDYFNLKK